MNWIWNLPLSIILDLLNFLKLFMVNFQDSILYDFLQNYDKIMNLSAAIFSFIFSILFTIIFRCWFLDFYRLIFGPWIKSLWKFTSQRNPHYNVAIFGKLWKFKKPHAWFLPTYNTIIFTLHYQKSSSKVYWNKLGYN